MIGEISTVPFFIINIIFHNVLSIYNDTNLFVLFCFVYFIQNNDVDIYFNIYKAIGL